MMLAERLRENLLVFGLEGKGTGQI